MKSKFRPPEKFVQIKSGPGGYRNWKSFGKSDLLSRPPSRPPADPAGSPTLRRACTHTYPPFHVHAMHDRHQHTQILIFWEKKLKVVYSFAGIVRISQIIAGSQYISQTFPENIKEIWDTSRFRRRGTAAAARESDN